MSFLTLLPIKKEKIIKPRLKMRASMIFCIKWRHYNGQLNGEDQFKLNKIDMKLNKKMAASLFVFQLFH